MGDFKLDDEYEAMRASTHRMPTTKIGAPSVIWQMAFWRPTHDNNNNELIPGIDDKAWHKRIDGVLLHLYNAFANCPEFVCQNAGRDGKLYLFDHWASIANLRSGLKELNEKDQSVRHNNFQLRAIFQGLRVIITARRGLEYFELVFAAELDTDVGQIRAAGGPYPIFEDIQRYHDIAIRHNRKFELHYIYDPSSEDISVIDRAQSNVIKSYRNWAINIINDALKHNIDDSNLSLESLGGLVADFIGIALSLKVSDNSVHKDQQSDFDLLPKELNNSSIELEPAYVPNPPNKCSKTVSAQMGGSFSEQNVYDMIDSVWPIVRGINNDASYDPKYGKPEYSVSILQKEGALHISSLGQFQSGAENIESGVYLLVVPYSNRYSLGRVIDRLHSAAILRLAAIREIHYLNKASDKINSLLLSMNQAGIEMPSEETVNGWQKEFGTIGGPFDDSNSIGINLMYRIDRSRYYAREFKAVLKLMGVRSVRGFQNYENFIARRLFSQFDHVDGIGRRYDEIRNQLLYLNSARQRAKLDALQSSIASNVAKAEGGVGKTNNLLESSEQQVASTNNLLATAETLSVFPIGYYVGNMLYDSMKSMHFLGLPEWIAGLQVLYFTISTGLAYLFIKRRPTLIESFFR